MFERSYLVLKKNQIDELKNKKVMVCGIGGVGGYVVENLARAGIGHLIIVDYDIVDISNKNRQIIALDSTLEQDKTEVMAKRLKDINADIEVEIINEKLTSENIPIILNKGLDYVVDAIDQLTAKIALIEYCKHNDTPIISSMGTGNKLDPRFLEITDIYKTDTDPLARIMRKELKNRNIEDLEVVFSREKSIRNSDAYNLIEDKRKPGSLPFVPASAGILIAYRVVMNILKI
ncbi:MAG: tRNA threonylcarbamoyladenosine dehydratase [Clostridiales bacterium]|nr:tRNA threonylcarbamoyladenosine dehydratase [Clostridiales bacterium]